MTQTLATIPEWHDVDPDRFENDVVPQNRPAVLRGFVKDWPAVQEAQKSPRAICDYLKKFDQGVPVGTVIGDASIQGRFFYHAGTMGFNFERRKLAVSTTLEGLLTLQTTPDPPSVFIESVRISEALPGFADENATAVLAPSVAPRIWIGNALTVATHYDLNDNIACVVAGRRRFTLFPPEQLPNLYVGPLERTPAGSPISMVDLNAPDFARYPRFEQALAAAMTAELEPGDAIYIPYFWWHHVQSLTTFNILVNYWWNDAAGTYGSPYHSLLYSLLAIQGLPAQKRDAWRVAFDYFVFKGQGEPAAHLPPEQQGVLGQLTPQSAKEIMEAIVRRLSQG